MAGSGVIPAAVTGLFIHRLHFLGARASAAGNKKPTAYYRAIKAHPSSACRRAAEHPLSPQGAEP